MNKIIHWITLLLVVVLLICVNLFNYQNQTEFRKLSNDHKSGFSLLASRRINKTIDYDPSYKQNNPTPRDTSSRGPYNTIIVGSWNLIPPTMPGPGPFNYTINQSNIQNVIISPQGSPNNSIYPSSIVVLTLITNNPDNTIETITPNNMTIAFTTLMPLQQNDYIDVMYANN